MSMKARAQDYLLDALTQKHYLKIIEILLPSSAYI